VIKHFILPTVVDPRYKLSGQKLWMKHRCYPS